MTAYLDPLELTVGSLSTTTGSVSAQVSASTRLVAKDPKYGAAAVKGLLVTSRVSQTSLGNAWVSPGLLQSSRGTFVRTSGTSGSSGSASLSMVSSGSRGVVVSGGAPASLPSKFIVVAGAVKVSPQGQTGANRAAAAEANRLLTIQRARLVWDNLGTAAPTSTFFGGDPHTLATPSPVETLGQATVQVSGLEAGPAYDVVFVAYDGQHGASDSTLLSGVGAAPGLTVSCSLDPGSSTKNGLSAVVDASLMDARFPDVGAGDPGRTYSVRLLARRADAISLQDLSDSGAVYRYFQNSSDAVTVGSGLVFATAGLKYTLGGLSSGMDYYVIALASEDSGSDAVHAFFSAKTGSLPPAVFVRSSRATDGAATLFVDVQDADSSFVLYAAAYLAPASGGTVQVPDPETAAGRVALKTAAAGGYSSGGHEQAFPRLPGGSPTFTSFTMGGLAPASEYAVAVLVEDADGNRGHALAYVSTQSAGSYRDEADYDDGLWELTWSSTVSYSLPVRGAPIGSGRIAARQSLSPSPRVGCEAFAVAGPGQGQGQGPGYGYGFDPTGFTFDEPGGGGGPPVCTFSPSEQTLNMYSGLCTTSYEVAVSGFAAAAANPQAAALYNSVTQATSELFCPRTMPSFTSATFGMRVAARLQGAALFQTMTAPEDSDAVFEGGLVYAPRAGKSVFLLSGEAAPATGNGNGARACASAYLFSGDFDRVDLMGFNSVRGSSGSGGSGKSTGFAAFRVSAPAGSRPTVTVLSAHVVGGRQGDARAEAKRMVLTALSAKTRNGQASDSAAAAKIRSEHVLAWAAAWRTGVEVIPRSLDAVKIQRVLEARRCLRQAQYTILSRFADDGASGLRGGGGAGGGIGSGGGIGIGSGPHGISSELWVVPALTFLRPRAAKALLSLRFDELEAARETARSQGLDGARFPRPTAGGGQGFTNAPDYDLMSSGYVFPSCLVALGAWNYFLATQDQEWLVGKGYSILSAVADMLVSAAEVSEVAVSTGSTELRATFGAGAVLDLDGEPVTDGVLTVHFGRLALRAAVEATYALRYPTKRSWQRLYAALRVDLAEVAAPGTSRGRVYVPRPHAAFAPGVGGAPPRLLDSLIVLTQHWSDQFGSLPQDGETLAEADRYFAGLQSGRDAALGTNLLTRVAVRAQSERADPAGTSAVNGAPRGVESTFELLLSAVRSMRADVWGAPADPGGSSGLAGSAGNASSAGNAGNAGSGGNAGSAGLPDDDAGLCAQILLLFVSSFAGIRVEGGFSPSGTTYRSLGLRASSATSNFPQAWKSVRVRTERDAPVMLSTGASGGQVVTEDLVVSNDVP